MLLLLFLFFLSIYEDLWGPKAQGHGDKETSIAGCAAQYGLSMGAGAVFLSLSGGDMLGTAEILSTKDALTTAPFIYPIYT